jgi:hypothetical protein
MAEMHLRGYWITPLPSLIAERFDASSREAFYAAIEGEPRAVLDRAEPKGWYDLDVMLKILWALIEAAPGDRDLESPVPTSPVFLQQESKRAVLAHLGLKMGEQASTTFMRLLMKLLSPRMLFNQFPLIWRRYGDFGKVRMDEIESDRLLMHVVGADVCPFITIVGVGWLHYVLGGMNLADLNIVTHPSRGIVRLGELPGWECTWRAA